MNVEPWDCFGLENGIENGMKKRMKFAVVLLFLLLGSVVNAQLPQQTFPGSTPETTGQTETPPADFSGSTLTPAQRRDSIRRAKLAGLARNKGETEYYYDLYMQSGLPQFDTMVFVLDGFQKYDPTYQHGDFRNSRGSLGMPDQLIEFNPRQTSGFNHRTNPYTSWFYTQENTPFLQTKTPYTYLYFVNNFGQDLNFFRAIHNQNVARGLNVGIDFRVYDVYGPYNNSQSNQYNVGVTGNVYGKHGDEPLAGSCLYEQCEEQVAGEQVFF